jgi:hypothetical protein
LWTSSRTGRSVRSTPRFPDLARAGHDLEALELDDVEKFISSEAAKGTEVFEAFGMKFPAGQITFWGIAVLLGVQLYFFVYLKQLSGRLGRTDAGWDVPWIGMDTSILARSIFFLTVVLLPCLTMALLGAHAISQLERPIIWKGWPVAEALGVAAASRLLLFRHWFSACYRGNTVPIFRRAATSRQREDFSDRRAICSFSDLGSGSGHDRIGTLQTEFW